MSDKRAQRISNAAKALLDRAAIEGIRVNCNPREAMQVRTLLSSPEGTALLKEAQWRLASQAQAELAAVLEQLGDAVLTQVISAGD